MLCRRGRGSVLWPGFDEESNALLFFAGEGCIVVGREGSRAFLCFDEHCLPCSHRHKHAQTYGDTDIHRDTQTGGKTCFDEHCLHAQTYGSTDTWMGVKTMLCCALMNLDR